MKTVVITGGSEGLGKTIASFLSSSYNIYILSRTKETLEKTANELDCNYKVCDVSKYDELEKIFLEIYTETKSIDVLINNAGLWIEGSLLSNDPNKIADVLQVNTLGVINSTKAVIPYMQEKTDGLIIQINSQSGIYGKTERSVYHASKWAVTGFTKSIQDELLPLGIRVTGLYPAKLETDMFSKQDIDKNMNDALDTSEVAKVIKFLIESKPTTFFPEIGIKRV